MRRRLERPIKEIICNCNGCCDQYGRKRIKIANEKLNGSKLIFEYLLDVELEKGLSWRYTKDNILNILQKADAKKLELIRLLCALNHRDQK